MSTDRRKSEGEIQLNPESVHILVVDDERTSRYVVSNLLKQLRYKVTTVDGGYEALQKLREEGDIQLMIVDVMMPEMDGFELLRIFKQAHNKDIPTIMMSASEDPETVTKVFQSGAEDFLQKPIRIEVLRKRVEMCLDDRIRRQNERYIKDMLVKERQERDKLSKQMIEKELELERMRSQITENIETPMQVVMNTISDLMRGNYSAEQLKASLIGVLKSLGTSDLYKPAFAKILAEKNSDMDNTTRRWLLSEFTTEKPQELLDQHSEAKQITEEPVTPLQAASLEHIQIPQEQVAQLRSYAFDVKAYSVEALLRFILFMFEDLGLIQEFSLDREKLWRFLVNVKESYHSNPYHNFYHAVDVSQFMYCTISYPKIAAFVSPVDKLAIIIAAVCHDADHPGLNNAFHINASSNLALLYNDNSVLENHHCAYCFKMMRDKMCDFMCDINPQLKKELRRSIIGAILSTDMASHFEIMSKFQTRLQTGPLSKDSKEDRQLVLNVLMKCSDISNVTRPIEVAKKWADFLIDEFLDQGDLEKKKGMPISPFMDRATMNKPRMQINFIDFVAGPLFKSLVDAFPTLDILTDTMAANRIVWEQILREAEQHTQPAGATVGNAPGGTTSTPSLVVSPSGPSAASASGSGAPANAEPARKGTDPESVLVSSGENDIDVKMRGITILLVDDDDTCLNVTGNFLIQAGYLVDTAENGEVALDKTSQKNYDIVLMDCHMPIMDGYEATRSIRDREKNTRRRTPIIAITGLGSDALEKSMKAGMDLCLSKPLNKRELLSVLERWTEISMETADCIDIDLALEQSGGDPDFLVDLLRDFVSMGEDQMRKLREPYHSKDWKTLHREAHSLKGASATLAAKPLAYAAFILEKAAKHEDIPAMQPALEQIEERLAVLTEWVNTNYPVDDLDM